MTVLEMFTFNNNVYISVTISSTEKNSSIHVPDFLCFFSCQGPFYAYVSVAQNPLLHFLQVSRSDVFQEVTMELAIDSHLNKYYTETIGSSAHWMTYVKK